MHYYMTQWCYLLSTQQLFYVQKIVGLARCEILRMVVHMDILACFPVRGEAKIREKPTELLVSVK